MNQLVRIMLVIIYSLSLSASDKKLALDKDDLQKQVEQVLLQEILISETSLWQGADRSHERIDPQEGDVSTTGIWGLLPEGHFSIKKCGKEIIIGRNDILGSIDQATPSEVLNKWIAKAITVKKFTPEHKINLQKGKYLIHKQCIDTERNPQVLCYVYDGEQNRCRTNLILKISTKLFQYYKDIYFSELLIKNSDKKEALEKRRRLLS